MFQQIFHSVKSFCLFRIHLFLKMLRLLQPMQLCQNIWYISRLDFGLFECKKSTFWLHFLFSNCSRHGHARLEEQLRTYSSHISTRNSDCQIAIAHDRSKEFHWKFNPPVAARMIQLQNHLLRFHKTTKGNFSGEDF